MIEIIRNVHARELCMLAQGDLSTLQYPLPSEIYGFHAQQASEKFLKALLTAKHFRYALTHNVEKLLGDIERNGEILPTFTYDLAKLQPFAVEFRYQASEQLNEEVRILIREAVTALRHHVIHRILDLQQPSS